MRNSLCAAAGAVALLSSATDAAANSETGARLDALLGQDREGVDIVAAAQPAARALPPLPSERGIETGPMTVSYDVGFIAAQPSVKGNDQWRCLSEALYFEARGESVEGIFAVGEVILNRVDSAGFPGSICGVVNQGTGQKYACQFSYTCDGAAETIHEKRAWRKVGKIAQLLIDGAPRQLTDGATYYHTNAVNPSWASTFAETAMIGVHKFYRG